MEVEKLIWQAMACGEFERIPFEWGIPSPWMAKKYPDAKNSSNARWRGKIIFKNGSKKALIRVRGPNNEIVNLFEFGYNKVFLLEEENAY